MCHHSCFFNYRIHQSWQLIQTFQINLCCYSHSAAYHHIRWGGKKLPCWILKLIFIRVYYILTLGSHCCQYHEIIRAVMQMNAERYVHKVWGFHSRLRYFGSWHCRLGNGNCDNTFLWNNGYHLQDYTQKVIN